jgi:alpha-glucosidase
MAYCFDLLDEPHGPPFLHGVFTRFQHVVGSGWPCWAVSNHEIVRVATRWGESRSPPRLLRPAAAMQPGLRGSARLYQGDELGLPEAEIRYEDLQAPHGIEMWPEYKGRDGCRTPMPWTTDAPDLGFRSGDRPPWLPVAESHRALAVDRQRQAPGSTLHAYRQLLR